MEDFVAWNDTRSGSFTVRSAYHVEFEHQYGRHWQHPDGQGSTSINPIWKLIWSLAIPGKVKHFVWKCLKGVLPCLGILAGRHIPTSAQCPVCKVGVEDIQHCLFSCQRAMKVWAELGQAEDIKKVVAEDRSGSVTPKIL